MSDNKLLLRIVFVLLLLFYLFGVLMNGSTDISIGILMIMLASILVFLTSCKHKDVQLIIIASFVVRISYAIYITVVGDPDPDGYEIVALGMAEGGMKSILSNFTPTAYLYSWFVSFFYAAFGSSNLMIRALNVFLSTEVVVLTYVIAKSLYGKDLGKRAVKLVAFFPSLVLFSSPAGNRETLLLFLLMLFLFVLYKYFATNNLIFLYISIPIIMLAVALHMVMFSLAIGLIYSVIVNQQNNMSKCNESQREKVMLLSYLNVTSLILFAIILIILIDNGWGTEKLYLDDATISGSILWDKFIWIQLASSRGRAAYLSSIPLSPLLVILFIPVRIVFFLFTPFVWMVRSAKDLLGLIDASLYLFLVFNIIKSMKASLITLSNNTRKYWKSLLIVAIIAIIVLAVGTSNYGTALRHRAKLTPLLVLLAMPGMKNFGLFKKRSSIRQNERKRKGVL